jgi:hypothetical protein
MMAAADSETMSFRIGSSWGVVRCHQYDPPRAAALSSVNPAIVRWLSGSGRTPMVLACWWAARRNGGTSTGCCGKR